MVMERRERKETRLERDVKSFCGWSYIKELVHLCSFPELIMGLFLTGGRATELLQLRKGHFREFNEYYEVFGMPVLKRYKVLDITVQEDGHKRYKTELLHHERTFPILKSEPFSKELWDYAQACKDYLFSFSPEYDDPYGKLYWLVRNIPAPPNPYAPTHLYPHWFRGQRASQLRIEYNLDVDQIMRFFEWKTFEVARRYAGMSSKDLAQVMLEATRR